MDYEFQWEGKLTESMQKCFDDKGFFIAKGFLDKEELDQFWKTLNHPDGILKHTYVVNESEKWKIRESLCSHPGSDVTGMFARVEKVAGSCDKLMGGEVYHWCSLLMLKDARVGGAHHWHQDYGYWYNDGVLFPDMITVWVTLDPARKDNSCKQVLSGSHKAGRIHHTKMPTGQYKADDERVEALKKRCPLLYLEMDPGDALFHHGNTLHASAPNTSDRRRWAFMSCFNKADNSPILDNHYPKYTPLKKVTDDGIKTCTNYTDFSGKDFTFPIH